MLQTTAYSAVMDYVFAVVPLFVRKFSLGIVAGSAILGMLIPPSVLMIVYGPGRSLHGAA